MIFLFFCQPDVCSQARISFLFSFTSYTLDPLPAHKKHSTLFFLAIKYIASSKFPKASKSRGLCKPALLKVSSSLPTVNSLSTAPARKEKLLNQKQPLKKGGKTQRLMCQKCVNRISCWIISSAQDTRSKIKINILLFSIKVYLDNNLYFQLLQSLFDWKPCVKEGQRKRKKGEFPSSVFRVASWQKNYFLPIVKKPKALGSTSGADRSHAEMYHFPGNRCIGESQIIPAGDMLGANNKT